MQTAAGESMYPIMSAITWNRTFQSMISTPIAALHVVLGTSMWMIVRLTIVSTAFVIVMIIFGWFWSRWGLLGALIAFFLVLLAIGYLWDRHEKDRRAGYSTE